MPGIPRNERAIAAATKNAARRVTTISAKTRAALRQEIVRAVRGGEHPSVVARRIVGKIGLNARQAAAMEKLRARLLKRATTEKQIAAVERKIASLTKRGIRKRAVDIARTETAQALSDGWRAGVNDAVKRGMIGPGARREWNTAGFDVCPLCKRLNNVKIPVDEEYPYGGGWGPPRHVRCRCAESLVPASIKDTRPSGVPKPKPKAPSVVDAAINTGFEALYAKVLQKILGGGTG
jgi:hypothetical protein